MIERIGHEQMPRTTHHDSKRVTQAGFERRALITPVTGHTNASNTFNPSSDPIPSTHQMIVRIGKEEIPLFIQCNPRWPRETAAGRLIRTLIFILTTITDHSSYEAGDRIDGANPSVETIGNEQRAICRKRQSAWTG